MRKHSHFSVLNLLDKIGKKAKIIDRYNQVLRLTQDTVWGSDKHARKHLKRRAKKVSLFPAGDHKAA